MYTLAGRLEGVLKKASESNRSSRPEALHTLQVLVASEVSTLAVKALWHDELSSPLPEDMSKEALNSLAETVQFFLEDWEQDSLSGSTTSMLLILLDVADLANSLAGTKQPLTCYCSIHCHITLVCDTIFISPPSTEQGS